MATEQSTPTLRDATVVADRVENLLDEVARETDLTNVVELLEMTERALSNPVESIPTNAPQTISGDGSTSPASQLFAHEKRINGMSLDDVLKRLEMHTWHVRPAPEHQLGRVNLTDAPGYFVTQTFTEKGLRWFLALLDLYEDFCGEYQALADADEESADSTPAQSASEIDPVDEAREQGQLEQILSAALAESSRATLE